MDLYRAQFGHVERVFVRFVEKHAKNDSATHSILISLFVRFFLKVKKKIPGNVRTLGDELCSVG